MMQTIPTLVKRMSLISALSLGAVGAFVLPAQAHYTTEQCDRDGDDCVRLVCDDDGDDCRPIAHYHLDNRPQYNVRQYNVRQYNAPPYNPWLYALGLGIGLDRGDGGHHGRWHGHHEEDDDD